MNKRIELESTVADLTAKMNKIEAFRIYDNAHIYIAEVISFQERVKEVDFKKNILLNEE